VKNRKISSTKVRNKDKLKQARKARTNGLSAIPITKRPRITASTTISSGIETRGGKE